MNELTKKKIARFKNLMPYIESKFNEGYDYDGVRLLLKQEHDLDVTKNVFRNYLSSCRKEIAKGDIKNIQQKTIIESQKLLPENINQVEKIEEIKGKSPQNIETSINDDDEIDLEAIKRFEAQLEIDKANALKPKSLLRKD